MTTNEAFFAPTDWGVIQTKVGPAVVRPTALGKDSVVVKILLGDEQIALAQVICASDHVMFLDIEVKDAYQRKHVHRGLRALASARAGKPWRPSPSITQATKDMYDHEGITPAPDTVVKPTYEDFHAPGELKMTVRIRSLNE